MTEREALEKILKVCEKQPEITSATSLGDAISKAIQVEEAFYEIEETCREALDAKRTAA